MTPLQTAVPAGGNEATSCTLHVANDGTARLESVSPTGTVQLNFSRVAIASLARGLSPLLASMERQRAIRAVVAAQWAVACSLEVAIGLRDPIHDGGKLNPTARAVRVMVARHPTAEHLVDGVAP